ncbi:MAG: hypothetical protein QF582_12155 [Alphaproteobacteria bacterium]|jgi:hypothetical protein|nr:hypothetical protein [Alphaproteobacteria bacterium]
MPETLLSPSNVLLFGRKMADLQIRRPERDYSGVPKLEARLATTGANIVLDNTTTAVDGVNLADDDEVLVKDQTDEKENGVYLASTTTNWVRHPDLDSDEDVEFGYEISVTHGNTNRNKSWILSRARRPFGTKPIRFRPKPARDPRHGPFVVEREGLESQLERQLLGGENPCFARIYAFSYEGVYYELPVPALFLVHGDGVEVSDPDATISNLVYAARRARAPGDPSRTGLAATNFQFAEGLRAWSYDKADYTIRMDVETGMFEQVLLGAEAGGADAMARSSGMMARSSGMMARSSGMMARGRGGDGLD